MIEVQHLRKQYGELVAVDNVSFTAESAHIFGLLGPNGAGKTTTIGRVRLLELVRAQARAGATVIYTTHYVEDAQELCDRIAIVDRGRLLAIGTLAELRGLVGEKDLPLSVSFRA